LNEVGANRYIKESEVGKSGGCHLFRHTCATLMLENGADTRFIQQLLGQPNITRRSFQMFTAKHLAALLVRISSLPSDDTAMHTYYNHEE